LRLGSEGQKPPKELAVVVYSVRVPGGDDFSERVFGLWLRELKDKSPVTLAGDYHQIVDAQYPLDKAAFELSNESQPEANACVSARATDNVDGSSSDTQKPGDSTPDVDHQRKPRPAGRETVLLVDDNYIHRGMVDLKQF
jgi:hypothetical protein